MSPRNNKREASRSWTSEETVQLIASIRHRLSEQDPLPYSRRIKELNWEEISIPFRSAGECKSRLDVVIKKVHRIRTLAEILSDVEFQPVAVDKKDVLVDHSVSAVQPYNEKKESDVVSGEVRELNNNSPKKLSQTKKSKSLSITLKSQRLKAFKIKRSYLAKSILFERYKKSKGANTRKDAADTSQDANADEISTTNACLSSSNNAEKSISTEQKRKLDENEPTLDSVAKKSKFDEHLSNKGVSFDMPPVVDMLKSIEVIPSSAYETKTVNNFIESNEVVTDLVMENENDEGTAMDDASEVSTDSMTNMEEGWCRVEAENDDVKNQKIDSPRIYRRIKNFCSGIFGRIGKLW